MKANQVLSTARFGFDAKFIQILFHNETRLIFESKVAAEFQIYILVNDQTSWNFSELHFKFYLKLKLFFVI